MPQFIAEDIEKYAYDHTKAEGELFKQLREETFEKMKMPHMQVGRIEGQFLKMLVRLTNARHILEIGMFTGYSALMMVEALPEDGELITCDIDPKAEEMAKRYFAQSPYGKKIQVRMGPALETIATIDKQMDMIFIDADKINYPNYYEACIKILKPGGLIVVDNVLWYGKVLNPDDNDTKAIDTFNKQVQQDPRVENVCLTVRDGMMLVWKKP
jgi:caffeoyl-CoA O-methyltransferase